MIFCLEDDPAIRSLIAYSLRGAGMECECFERPTELRTALEKTVPELLLLDIMLPEEDGLSVLRSLRGSTRTAALPVILLTARGSEYDRILGLDTGADDYVTKPFSVLELLARVRALLRRSGGGAEILSAGSLSLDEQRHEVRLDGQVLPLTLREFRLLSLLLQERGRVLTRDELLNRLWGYSFDGESRTVDVHIRSLRQKLGSAGAMIETVRGVGYRFS